MLSVDSHHIRHISGGLRSLQLTVCFGVAAVQNYDTWWGNNHISLYPFKQKKKWRVKKTYIRAGQLNPVRLQEHKAPLTALQQLAGEHEAGR